MFKMIDEILYKIKVENGDIIDKSINNYYNKE